jgi:hypothetical protein
MNLHGLEEDQVEFIINCIEKASVKTTEQQELLAWITLQYVHQQKGGAFKKAIRELGYAI